MGAVTANMSVSLDGFFVGPNDDEQRQLGDGGEVLHRWIFSAQWGAQVDMTGQRPRSSATGADADVLGELFTTNGAVVMGRRSFDIAQETWGAAPPFRTPVFVLTHTAPGTIVRGDTVFTFVTNGFDQAIQLAKAAAGENNVALHGGTAVRQGIRSRLLDELQIHLVPVLLGAGKRLLDDIGQATLERTRVIESPEVTHLRFRVVK